MSAAGTPDGDPTADLADRLERLEGMPVDAHPDVLEEVHSAIVEELDRLATGTAGTSRGRPAGT